MPPIGPSFFARCREGLDSRQDAKPPRNKLRKRPPLPRYTKSEQIITKPLLPDASETPMGNHVSALKPRPVRPPRPSHTDLPSLPSLPIYQTVISQTTRCFDDQQKPLIPPKSPSRKSSVKEDWPLPSAQHEVHPMPTKPPSSEPIPPIATSGAQTASHIASPPPQYDRASHLASAYQSLLPEIDHDNDWTVDWEQPTVNPPQYKMHQCSSDATRNFRPRPLRTSRSSPMMSSSTNLHQPSTPSPPPCNAVSQTDPSLPQQTRQLTTAITSLNARGTSLDLCAELLTHELTHALQITRPQNDGSGTSKLQILLLIEAYEATLDTCRRELTNIAALEAAPTQGGEDELGANVLRRWEEREEETRRRRRQWHIQEAIAILGHWLGVLYRIYDGIYEEAWEGERRVDGIGMI